MSKKQSSSARYENLDYAEDIQIDQDNLDLEWMDQPGLIMKYAEALADAKDELDRLKREEQIIRSEIALDVRQDPKAYDITDKLTEAMVKEAVECSEEVDEIFKKILKKSHEVAILGGAVKSIDVKKTALENLVRLHGQNYFSSPRTNQEGAEVLDESKKTRSANAIKRQRRIKK